MFSILYSKLKVHIGWKAWYLWRNDGLCMIRNHFYLIFVNTVSNNFPRIYNPLISKFGILHVFSHVNNTTRLTVSMIQNTLSVRAFDNVAINSNTGTVTLLYRWIIPIFSRSMKTGIILNISHMYWETLNTWHWTLTIEYWILNAQRSTLSIENMD